jgi:hypothetical protein
MLQTYRNYRYVLAVSESIVLAVLESTPDQVFHDQNRKVTIKML